MFISNEEKQRLTNLLDLARHDILLLKRRIEDLEKKAQPKKPPKKTEEQLKAELKKARQRVYGRTYYQRKKEREQVLNVGS